MVLCDGVVDSHQKQKFKSIAHWEHLSFADFAIFNLKRQLKLLEMACDQVLTCLMFSLRWACFPIKSSHIVQYVHLFLMDFDDSQ